MLKLLFLLKMSVIETVQDEGQLKRACDIFVGTRVSSRSRLLALHRFRLREPPRVVYRHFNDET